MIKLDSEQQIDLTVLDVKDIVDQSVLQSFLENYALSVGLAVVVADRNGEKIVDGCMSRDASIGSSAVVNRIVDTVSNTLRTYSEITQTDSHIFAVPVIVKDHVLGAVICEDVNAGDNNIDAAITVVEIFVASIVEAGYNRVSVEALASQLAENFIQVSKTLEELALSAQNITEQQQSLGEDISKVESVTSEISDITGSINKLADRTMMLGLNASIEAARLGNDGRGFAVVATQIRELSASSRKTSEDIKKLNDQINEYVVSTISNSRESLKTTEDQSAAMQELSATIQTMVAVAQSLKEMYM
ncbi:methyl-accepting chemotaxis protein [Lachnospiraceae bacterium HCP1S3_C3]|nr:methyl-accepting chemotaxis protein [Lachnospiraceae bacterium]